HVFGKPALVARLPAGDAQRVAFLTEQRVAAVAGAEALDRQLLGEVQDEAALRIEISGRVQAAYEGTFSRNPLERRAAGARHERHVENHIGAVGDLYPATRIGRIDRTHAVR